MTHAKRSTALTLVLIPVLWWLSPVKDNHLFAQAETAGSVIVGTVRDASGALIPQATVTLLDQDQKSVRQAATSDEGAFELIGVAAGRYDIEFSAVGFKDRLIEEVQLGPGETLPLDVTLDLAERTDQAEVVAERDSGTGVRKLVPIDAPIGLPPFMKDELPKPPLRVRGRIYSDWFGINTGGRFVSQFSNRVRMDLGDAGAGWSARFDVRDRVYLGNEGRHQLSLYDVRLTYDHIQKPVYLAIGQMNLYDTAGIGELLGGVAAYRPDPRILIGGYGGLLPNLYETGVDPSYQRYGIFAHYLGPKAQTFSLSLNEIRYSGQSERRYVYFTGLTHAGERAILYGNLEFEAGSAVKGSDRLSRVFTNARIDLTSRLDVTFNLSSGKGLDFHRFVLDRLQDPLGDRNDLERFYYNTQYGARLRYRVSENWRLYFGQSLSERKDRAIKNRTTQLGLSVSQIAQSGLSVYANYNLNRGDQAESDSLCCSISKALGRRSWTTSYSTSFNALRFSSNTVNPEVIHLPSTRTLFNELFLVITRGLAFAVQYEHAFGLTEGEDLLFARIIIRM